MADKNIKPDKKSILKAQGTLNTNPNKIKNPLFREHEFFDPHDLLQVKYEMIRQVEKDGISITQASSNFGYSRFTFYRFLSNFKTKGMLGLIPQKRGPVDGHKLSKEIMDFIENKIKEDGTLKIKKLKKIIEKRFNIKVHPRSIERAIARRKKNHESNINGKE